MKRYDVFGIGTALVDCLFKVNEKFLKTVGLVKGATNFLPRKTLDELELLTRKNLISRLPGDNARNVCEGVVALGGSSTYAGTIGKDAEGRFLSRALKKLGIKSLLAEKPGRTGKILAYITPDRERTFAVDLGNGLNYDILPDKTIKQSRHLYLTSITILANGPISKCVKKAIEVARKNETKVAFSLESPPMIAENRKKLIRLIGKTDILFANEAELAALGVSPKEICNKVRYLFLKRGERGSTIFCENETFQIPKYSKKVVDTTGAGDYYAAGALFSLSRGEGVEKAGHTGARLAARIVERFGASFYRASPPKEKRSNASFRKQKIQE